LYLTGQVGGQPVSLLLSHIQNLGLP